MPSRFCAWVLLVALLQALLAFGDNVAQSNCMNFRVSNTGADPRSHLTQAYTPVAAFAEDVDRFLIVWHASETPAQWEIYARVRSRLKWLMDAACLFGLLSHAPAFPRTHT